MENNNWKWYEDNASGQGPQNNASGSANAGGSEGSQPNGAYDGYQNHGGAYNPYGEGSGGGGKKPKEKRFTLTQFLITLLATALLFTSVGLAVGSITGKTADGEQAGQTALNEEPTAQNPSIPVTEQENQNSGDTHPSQGISMSSGGEQSTDTKDILHGSMRSVVGIDIEAEVSTNYWYGGTSTSDGSTETVGSGSGVIITADGYIVTNNHVISGAEIIKVYLQDGMEYEATLIGADSITDLAVIKIEAKNLPAATLGSSGDVTVGESVYAIGNPLGVLATSVSQGIISGLDREITVEDQQMTLMQTDAAVNPGNSGGGLFNSNGELIGIVNSKASGNDVEGLGFAIPIDTAKPILVDLMDLGFVSGRPYLGILMQNVTYSTGGGSNGQFNPWSSGSYVTRAQVYSVEDGSPAAKAGMLANDVILAFNGESVYSSTDISARLYEYEIGDAVKITVQRGNEQVELSITLGERTK